MPDLLPTLADYAAAELKGVSIYRHASRSQHPRPLPIPEFHERVELVTGGYGAIEHQGGWFDVSPGDLLWNQPGDYTIGRTDFEDPYRCLSITLTVPRPEGMGAPRFTRWEDLDAVVAFSYEMTKHFIEGQVDRAAVRDCLLGRLLLCVQMDRNSRHGEIPLPLKRVLRWIKLHYANPCPVEMLAEIAGWSPVHLHHSFRRHLKTTPHQTVLQERLMRAREQLVTTSHPVKQIAVECGFSDTPAFTRAFKNATGLTPAHFRRTNYAIAGY